MPKISVIIATYNRSNVLYFAVQSVLWQTFQDWELIVVGDCCTDDTPEVMSQFDDPRVKFINMKENYGEQSGPNNHGVALAEGEFIAYLNHDDLWLPDHLEKMLSGIEETKSDLVFCMIESISRPKGEMDTFFIATPENRSFDGSYFVPASSWLLRKSLLDEIGLWVSFRETYATPSQEFIDRARKRGKKVTFIPEFTAISIPSAFRKEAYKNREFGDNKYYFEQIRDDASFREKELLRLSLLKNQANLKFHPPWVLFKRACKNLFRNTVTRLGIQPSKLGQLRYSWRKGGFLNHIRKNRGLAPLKLK
jgi:glycosyltransferase involved in cell wall biosynthesis